MFYDFSGETAANSELRSTLTIQSYRWRIKTLQKSRLFVIYFTIYKWPTVGYNTPRQSEQGVIVKL